MWWRSESPVQRRSFGLPNSTSLADRGDPALRGCATAHPTYEIRPLLTPQDGLIFATPPKTHFGA